MVRPLAIAGFTLLISLFFCVQLPSWVLLPLAVILLALIVACVFIKPKYYQHLCLIFSVIVTSIIWFNLYNILAIKPIEKYIDNSYTVNATVMQTEKSFIPLKTQAVLKIEKIDGVKVNSFKVVCSNMSEGEIGDKISITLDFENIENPSLRTMYLADNIILQATAKDNLEFIGTDNSLFFTFAKLQKKAVQLFENNFSKENSQVLSAIIVGDKSQLSNGIKQAFRLSGLSHILVVSGLHLSIIIMFSNFFIGILCGNQKISAILSLGLLGCYVLFTGFSPSIIRAAVVVIFVLLGKIFVFGEDFVTSMATALIIILFSTPYACLDVGMLLSFSAAGGIMVLSHLKTKIKNHNTGKWYSKLLFAFLVPISAMLATLPVQIYIGGTISLAGIIANMAVVAVLTPLLVLGFLVIPFMAIEFLYPIKAILIFIINIIVGFLNMVAKLTAEITVTNIPVQGLFAVVVCICIFSVGFILYKNKRYTAMVVSCVLIIVYSVSLGVAINYNTIKIAPIGNNKNPAVVITQNNSACVIFKGNETAIQSIKQYFLQHNITDVQLVIDIDNKDNTELLQQAFNTKNIYLPTGFSNTKTVFRDILIDIRKQDASTACIINTYGYTTAVTNGKTNWQQYPEINAYIAGTSVPENLKCETVLALYGEPKWIAEVEADKVLQWQKNSYVWVRPNAAIKIVTE